MTGDREYVNIPGNEMHELPPLLVRRASGAPDVDLASAILEAEEMLLLDDSVALDDVVIKECRENLDIVPSHPNLSSCQIRLANDINMQFKLRRKLKALTEGNQI